jgi:hypothetical protein
MTRLGRTSPAVDNVPSAEVDSTRSGPPRPRWAVILVLTIGLASLALGVAAMPALAYKPQSRTADPSAWGELSTADQNAVLEYVSRGTPGEATHYATTPTELAEVQALEDAAAAAREAAPLADLVAGSGAAAQGAKLLPGLAELAPWNIAAGAGRHSASDS